jgi:aldose 1-epimerase
VVYDLGLTTVPDTLRLQVAESVVLLCPSIGGSIARFSWRGHEILRRAPDAAIDGSLVRQMACYPLVPYSNRIGNAALIASGKAFPLRANAPPEPHALHGFGWQREWQIASHSCDAADLTLNHIADEDWPFVCKVRQRICLKEGALQLGLTVTNTDRKPMPTGLGFHPYFPISGDTKLQATWKNMWQVGADALPTELGTVTKDGDFTHLRRVDGWKIDNCFTGWDRRLMLKYSTHRVRLEASMACRHIVCFAPHDACGFIALEPVTNINNAFALAAKGIVDTGMKMLGPGESLEISVSIVASSL